MQAYEVYTRLTDQTALSVFYITAKTTGCFKHTVVTLVADKLERQWL